MPQNITDVDTFTDPVTAPADGDPLNAASIINDGLQDLSNRTRRLMSIAEGSQDVQTPQTFTRTVSAAWLVPAINPGAVVQWETDGTEGWRAVAAIVGELRGSLNDLLPEGATVTRIRAMVDPASARAGANRMGLELRRVTYTLPAAPAVKPASDASVSLFATFDDTTADQLRSLGLGRICRRRRKRDRAYVYRSRAPLVVKKGTAHRDKNSRTVTRGHVSGRR